MSFSEYKLRSESNVRAEKVTDDAVTVVTINGVRTAHKGDYVVELQGKKLERNEESGEFEEVTYSVGTDIVNGEEFEAVYEPVRKRSVPKE